MWLCVRKKALHEVADAGFGQELMGSMRNRIGIEVERVVKNANRVAMSVRVLIMRCGSVQHNAVEVEITF